ncbi:serine/threonine-protein phosphatase 4 regulatory subunit 4-like [Ornithodoros turicata]|uniref:serine/threonine-protein phosphatase 4 regulatory subunit 4-like n=1 Tax=Ornithodoros turicata TaxID=34597 RepID=UPI003139062D
MWLPGTEAGQTSHADPGNVGRNCASPPLEGGEAPCDTCTDRGQADTSDDKESLGSGDTEIKAQETKMRHRTDIDQEEHPDLLTLFNQSTATSNTFTHSFLQSILSSVESKDPVVASAWVETLLDVMDLLPKDVLRKDILTLAVNKGQLSQPEPARVLCCRLLGKICIKLDPYVVKKEALPLVQSLCQDVEHTVRACMCRHLDSVTRAIGLETTKNVILPELVEMANDEHCSVRLAAIETVVNMLPLLDDDSCRNIIIPLVKKFTERSLHITDSTLPAVSREMGRLCLGLAESFLEEEREWFLDLFRQLARCGLPSDTGGGEATDNFTLMPDLVPVAEISDKLVQCRNACAYNFPAMVAFVGPHDFKEKLFKPFQDLCRDPHSIVRRTVASGLHEVVRVLGRSSSMVLDSLIHLLCDTNCPSVLLSRLPLTLSVLAPNCKQQQLESLIEALECCESSVLVSSCWRLHVEALHSLGALSSCHTLHTRVSRLLLNRLHAARALPCRLAASHNLLLFLRDAPSESHRRELVSQIIQNLSQGQSCRSRMLYVRLCGQAMLLFSKRYFKDNFFHPLLLLSGDKVANVRLKVCEMLPSLKSLLVLPRDESSLQQLEAVVGKLLATEVDKDVSAALRNAIDELDRIEVPTEKDSGSRKSPGVFATGSLTQQGKIPVRERKATSRLIRDVPVRPVSMVMRSNKVAAAEIKRLHRLSLDSNGVTTEIKSSRNEKANGPSKLENRIPVRVTLGEPRLVSFHMPAGMRALPLPPITSHLPACRKPSESPRSTSRIPTPRMIRRRPQSECLDGIVPRTSDL